MLDYSWLRKRNAENWLSFNNKLVKKIQRHARSSELFEYGTKTLKISKTQVSKRLKAGVEYGIIEKSYPTPERHKAYVLTDWGRELLEALNEQEEG